MKFLFALALCLLLSWHPARAQDPVPAARGKEFEASAGYQFLSFDSPTGRENLEGAHANMTVRFTPRIGIKADVGYARTLNWFSPGNTATALTYLGGPVVDLLRTRRFSTYGQFLVGGAKITAAVPFQGTLAKGLVNNVAIEGGVGGQFQIMDSVAVRVEGSYLNTQFYNPSLHFSRQNNFLATTSLVYCFGKHSR